MNKNNTYITLIIASIFLLSACGGSSTNDTSPQSLNTPLETPSVDETPADETPDEETPVDETPVDEKPVEETPVDETPVDETPVDETPVDETIGVNLVDLTIIEGGLVTLQAETTTDLDEETLAYAWTITPHNDLVFSGGLSNTIDFIAPFSDGEDIILAVTVKVTDNTGYTASASSTVTVFNDIPRVSLSNNISGYEKQDIAIDSVITSESNIVSYVWTITNLPAESLMTDDDSATLAIPPLVEDVSASITLMVTDSDGDSALTTTELKAMQLFEPLIIEGLITDSVIKNSIVNVAIGDRQIQLNADENGYYSTAIKIDDDETDSMITITGVGIEDQSNAGLVSILGSAKDLLAQAGNDGVLNANKNFDVNVTHVTSAKFGLMMQENDGQIIDRSEVLAELSAKIDFNQVMTIANAIKLTIDYSSELSVGLPNGMTNTLDLIEDIPVALAYAKTLSANTQLYNNAYNATLNDPNIIRAPLFAMPESLHWLPLGVPNYSVPIWQFYNNNQGSYAGNVFTWQVEGNVITGNYISPVIESNSEELFTPDGIEVVDYQEIPTSFVITIVNENSGLVEFVHNRTVTKLYDSDTIERLGIDDPSGEYTFINGHTSYRNSARQNITDLAGKVAYLPIKTIQINDEKGLLKISADKYSFAENGIGTTLYSGKTFTWLQTDNSVVISTEISDDIIETATISLFHDGTSVGPTGFNLTASDTDDITTLGGIAENNINWNPTEIAGIYESTFKSRENTLSHLWFELKENGDADTFATNDDNGDGVISASELYQAYGKWAVENNKLTVTRIVKVNTEESSPEHREPDGDEWQQYHQRTWELITRNNNRYGILNKHNFTLGLAYPQNFAPEVAEVIYDIRLLEKLNEAPVDISHLIN
jgi:hypothetical protein